ncbi:MAG: hypothetical protein U9Q30_01545 [Campylobacterota bacterium]|nr:hypothetical protein [Campylobacterota bacterium]
MKLDLKEKPRVFEVKSHKLNDFGKIMLDANEMVSFKTQSDKEYDFVAKEWGFYATPSINGRLKNEGFKTALVINENSQIYIMVIEEDKIESFKKYLKDNQDNKIICWLDEWLKEEF